MQNYQIQTKNPLLIIIGYYEPKESSLLVQNYASFYTFV